MSGSSVGKFAAPSFQRSDTHAVVAVLPANARSGWPSPSKSAAASARAPGAGIVVPAVNVPVPSFRNTEIADV
jgi:hypothetical protein